MEFDIEKDLSINKLNLDAECLSHASLYFKYADACSDAKTEVSNKKDMLKATLASREIAIRANLAESGVKATEALVTAKVTSDEEVLRAQKELREAEATWAKLQVAVDAMDTRRSELDNLVKLYCAGFYASNDARGYGETRDREQMIRDEITKGVTLGN